MSNFVHLHTHTEFSLLDGLSSPRELANYAVELGMDALAITDHGVMFGVVDFYQACQSAGIKPIIGIEAYVARTSRHSRNRDDGKPYHIVLLAQNQTGYQNLLELASLAQLEGFYYKPRIDKEILARHSAGVIALTACVQGEIPQLLHAGRDEKAREAVRWYQEHFPDRFYIELQTHDIPEFDPTYEKMIALAREMNVPLAATNDIHYAKPDQAEAHDVLLCIGTGKSVNETKRMRMTDNSYYMRSPEEMWELYGDIPEALENTVKIAEQCNVEIQFAPPYHLPQFPVPEGCGASEEYLRHLCYEGLVMRYGEARAKEPEVIERMEHELGIIHEMGFDDYFLIVWDLCEAAKERDIWWNVRGSGAGSVVAYTLEITHVDPFKNRLMFERFLNPARVNMPDIDLDYPDDRREELIEYTVERYGADHVAAIITFGTLGARAAIRDVGRALDIPLGEVDRVARMVPNVPGKPVSIAQALEQVSELREIYDSTPYIKRLLDTAQQVEGTTRHASTHAAGILVSDKPLVAYLPLHRPTKGSVEDSPVERVSQWPMEIVDAMGMLKVDFLGLRTLTSMRRTCEWIEKEHGVKLDLFTIPYERAPDDPEKDAKVKKLYELLASGETTGVFQVEGAGMRRTLNELRPQEFQHIIAVLALYRPGPMENIPTYIRRLHGEEEVKYHHPILEDILGDTYGICVSGDTLVTDVRTGQRLRIDQLGDRRDVQLQGIDDQWEIAYGCVTHWIYNGRKPVLRLTLRNGASIKATSDHRFLTEEGWKSLSELHVGDYVATPSALISQDNVFDQHKLRILAYLLGDGDLGNLASVNFISKDPALLAEYESCLTVFDNLESKRVEQVRDVTRVTVAKSTSENYHDPNALLSWLRDLGLKNPAGDNPGGVRAAEKFVPEFVFGLKQELIAFFLASLWDCDGYAGPKIWHYKTISSRLARDVQTLLLKLGVPSRIYCTEYTSSRGERTSYQVTVYETSLLATWLKPHLLSSKREMSATACMGTTIAREPFIAELEAATSLSKRALMRQYGIDRQHFSPAGRQRERIHTAIVAPLFSQLSLPETEKRSRLVWEEVVNLEPAGIEDVYDITVENLHNFVANNIIAHNCVYQEQIMQIAVQMAGYKPGEADMIRKAVAKKKKKLMEKHKKLFREGAIKKGIAAEIADAVWSDIEFFARYGFNRAHATDYAVITAQTAYLKAHYPLEFMTGLMTTERHNVEKLGYLITDARRNDLEVRGPDVNVSDVEFSIGHEKDGRRYIRIGLGAIKNVGDDAMQVIVDARREGGPFASLDDFAERVDLRKVNRKTMECLIQAGALDTFGERPKLLTLIDAMIGASSQIHHARDVGQITLFGDAMGSAQRITIPAFAPPIDSRQLFAWEKELLGAYLSEHPLERRERELRANGLISTTIAQIATEQLGQQFTLVGMVQRVKRITTKKGNTMAFVTLEGPGGTLDVVVFPKAYERFKSLLIQDEVLVASGKLDDRQDRDDHPLLADWFKRPEQMLHPTNHAPQLDQIAQLSQGDYGMGPSYSNDHHTVYNAVSASDEGLNAPQLDDGEGYEPAASSPSDLGRDNGGQRTPPPPDEPPSPPSILYITLQRSGDHQRDFDKLSQIHQLLCQRPGGDEFIFLIEGRGYQRIELIFPEVSTQYSLDLRERVEALVGKQNLRVVTPLRG